MTEEYRAKLPELKGKENFAGWFKLTDTYLIIKGLKKVNGDFETEKKGEAYLYLLSTLSYNIAAEVPNNHDPVKLLTFLKKQYGCSNPYQALERFDKIKMTNIDPTFYISDLRKAENSGYNCWWINYCTGKVFKASRRIKSRFLWTFYPTEKNGI
ncbi:MAG: hypothetical protein RL711_1819 [Bacteroidota bacterium]